LTRDFYAVLGLLRTAEPVVVKAAYKALAQRYHPDRFPGDADFAKSRMADLNEAYRVLSNPQRRQAYDREMMGELAQFDDSFAEWIRAFVDAKRHGD
jgi:molecular chaperone DnaJ